MHAKCFLCSVSALRNKHGKRKQLNSQQTLKKEKTTDNLYIESVNSLQVPWQQCWGFLCDRRQEGSRYAQGGRAVNIELLGDGEADKLVDLMWIELHWGFQNWVARLCVGHVIQIMKKRRRHTESYVLRQDMSCWQGDAGPVLSTAAEERTQKREVTREGRRRYSARGQ